MHSVIRWLSRGKMPLLVDGQGSYCLAFRKDLKQETMVGFFNLTLDAWPEVIFELYFPQEFRKILQLTSEGTWAESEIAVERKNKNMIKLIYSNQVHCNEPLFLRIV